MLRMTVPIRAASAATKVKYAFDKVVLPWQARPISESYEFQLFQWHHIDSLYSALIGEAGKSMHTFGCFVDGRDLLDYIDYPYKAMERRQNASNKAMISSSLARKRPIVRRLPTVASHSPVIPPSSSATTASSSSQPKQQSNTNASPREAEAETKSRVAIEHETTLAKKATSDARTDEVAPMHSKRKTSEAIGSRAGRRCKSGKNVVTGKKTTKSSTTVETCAQNVNSAAHDEGGSGNKKDSTEKHTEGDGNSQANSTKTDVSSSTLFVHTV